MRSYVITAFFTWAIFFQGEAKIRAPTTTKPTTPTVAPFDCTETYTQLEGPNGTIVGPDYNSTAIDLCQTWTITGETGQFVLLVFEVSSISLYSGNTLTVTEGQTEIIKFDSTVDITETLKVASLSPKISIKFKGRGSNGDSNFAIQFSTENTSQLQTTLTDSSGYIHVTGENYLNYQYTWYLDSGDRNSTIDIVIESAYIYDTPLESISHSDPVLAIPNGLYGSHLSIGSSHSVLKQNPAYMTTGKVTKPLRLKIAKSTAYVYLYARDFSLPEFGFYLTYNYTELPQITTETPTTPSPYVYTGNYSVAIVGLRMEKFVTSETLPTLFQNVMQHYTEIYCNVNPAVTAEADISDTMLATGVRKGSYVGFQMGLSNICSRTNRTFDVKSLSDMLDAYGDEIERDFGYEIVMEFSYSKLGWIFMITITLSFLLVIMIVIGQAKRKYHYKRVNHHVTKYKEAPVSVMPEPVATIPFGQFHTNPANRPTVGNNYESAVELNIGRPGQRFNRHTPFKMNMPSTKYRKASIGSINFGFAGEDLRENASTTDDEILIYSANINAPAPPRIIPRIPIIEHVYDTVNSDGSVDLTPFRVILDSPNATHTGDTRL